MPRDEHVVFGLSPDNVSLIKPGGYPASQSSSSHRIAVFATAPSPGEGRILGHVPIDGWAEEASERGCRICGFRCISSMLVHVECRFNPT